MLKACPHCQAPLQPGEAYLGWCGACGNSLWQLPSRRRQSERAAPAPEEWRWVARGALLKLVALLAGAGACLAITIAADWDAARAVEALLPAGMVVLLIAVVLDVVGRVLCLATPQAAIRLLIIGSVVCQVWVIVMVVGIILTPRGQDQWLLLPYAVPGQVLAAATFTVYLFTVGVYFRNRLMMQLARLITRTLALMARVAVVTTCVVIVLAVLLAVGVFFLCGGPCGCLYLTVVG
jgi:hypothetical protein